MGEKLTAAHILNLGFVWKARNPFNEWYTFPTPIDVDERWRGYQVTLKHNQEEKHLQITAKIGGDDETLFQGRCHTEDQLKLIWSLIKIDNT